MNSYIIESMALVGCGVGDTKQIATIVSHMTPLQHDALDAMYNFGANTELLPKADVARQALRQEYDEDELVCLSAYVNAMRSVA